MTTQHRCLSCAVSASCKTFPHHISPSPVIQDERNEFYLAWAKEISSEYVCSNHLSACIVPYLGFIVLIFFTFRYLYSVKSLLRDLFK